MHPWPEFSGQMGGMRKSRMEEEAHHIFVPRSAVHEKPSVETIDELHTGESGAQGERV
jgi:hypothetical protein